MELKGCIEDIIYQNEENGYTICEMIIDDERITAVGYLPFINKGDTLKIIRKICYTSRIWKTIQNRHF